MDIFKLGFISAYTVCKIPFSNVGGAHFQSAIKPIIASFATLLLILAFTFVIPFLCFRSVLRMYLIAMHGNNFVKMLKFRDTTFLYSEHGSMRVSFIVECSNGSDYLKVIRNAVKTILEEVAECSSVVRKCLGYYYLLRKPVNLEEVFSVVPTDKFLTADELSGYLASCEATKNEVFQVKWIKEPLSENRYILFILIHHCLSDGHSILKVLFKYLLNDTFIPMQTNTVVSQSLTLDKLFVDPDCFKKETFDCTLLPCNNVYGATFSEQCISCLPKLKALRRKLKCSINEIMIGLISWSLFDYMKERGGICPRSFSLTYIRPFYGNQRGNNTNKILRENHLVNNAIPVALRFKNERYCHDFWEFLGNITSKYKQSICSMETQIIYFTINYILDYLPVGIHSGLIQHIIKQPVLIFSNIGSINSSTLFSNPIVGCPLGMGCAQEAGLCTAFCTYDGKLQVLMEAKLHFLKFQSELQAILDNAITHLHELYDEIQQD